MTTADDAAEAREVAELIGLFNRTFLPLRNTVLEHSPDEPIYLPADDTHPHHRICLAHGYFASALHEIAHWCIAGDARRLRVDFGYWYAPDGRNARQQAEFEKVEVKPQALEWILNRACGRRFRVSLDNLNGEAGSGDSFRRHVHAQTLAYLRDGLPRDAAILRDALLAHYRPPQPLVAEMFRLEEL